MSETQALLAAIADGVVVVDRRGLVVEANTSALALLERPREDVVGHRVDDVPPLASLAGAVRDEFAAGTADRRRHLSLSVEVDGEEIPIDAVLAVAPTPGEPRVVVTMRTEMRTGTTATTAARTGAAVVAAVGRTLDTAFCVLDADGVVCFANRAAVSLLGLEVGHDRITLHQLLHGQPGANGHAAADCPLHQAVARRETLTGESDVAVAGGTTRRLGYRAAALLGGDSSAGVVLTLDDMTRRRREEERWRRARVSARRDRRVAAHARRENRRISGVEEAKTRFLSVASHELRSSLTVLGGYLSLLDAGSLGGVGPELRGVMPLLISKVQQMNTLVDEMLETARLEDGRLELSLQPSSLCDLIRTAAAATEGLRRPDHVLRLELPTEDVLAAVDVTRLQVAVTNLLHNSFKYSPEGGVVRCTLRAEPGRAVIEVADQGLGIAPEHMAVLFTRFGRIRTPDTESIAGTGLGLYLARQLVRLHGGEITCSSTVGVGTVFTVVLPLGD